MTTPTHMSRRSLLGLASAAAGAAVLGACGDGNDSGSDPKTIEWWHISVTEPGLSVWAGLARAFEATRPGVKVNITTLENEAFKSKLTTVTQAGTPPDVFHSWGGGVLKQQADAGLVKDITESSKSWINTINQHGARIYQVNGKQYGVPFDLGMVGFWYNKELFGKAGITTPPATWAELLDVVKKLKNAGITPIALAGAEKWPGHFYWSYLAIRQAGVAGMAEAAKDGSFDRPDFVTAGVRLKELVDLQPFQAGFLGAKYSANDGQPAFMGNGQTAMELMGQWAPPTQAAYSTSKQGIGDKLGFFPFPAVDGGKGSPSEIFGGGNGFALGKNASAEAVEFVKFLLSADSQRKLTRDAGGVLPVTTGAEDALVDTNLKSVHQTVSKASGFQLYLDQAYPPAVGQQVNDSVAELIAGKSSPEQVAKAIAKTAKSQ
jgi:raffinose/stachyose/melibiose transport system substrate-binding protein